MHVLTYPSQQVSRANADGTSTPYAVTRTTDSEGLLLGVWVSATTGKHGGPYFLLPAGDFLHCCCSQWDMTVLDGPELGINYCHHIALAHEAALQEAQGPAPVGERDYSRMKSPRLVRELSATAKQVMEDYEIF